MLFDAFWITVRNKIKNNVLFKECFQTCKYYLKPCIESVACFTSSSPLRVKPELVILTNVVPSSCAAKVHSTVFGAPYPGHSMTMRLFASTVFTVTGTEISYISQSHCTCLPSSRLPLLVVNQNFVVISGLTKASKTSATGLRINIPVLTTGISVNCRLDT